MNKDTANVIVPDALVDDLVAWYATPSPYARLFRQPSWEDQLRWAIAERSLRRRWARARLDASARLSLARDALLGRHECDRW